MRITMVEILIFAGIAGIVGMLVYNCMHPCARYDPLEKTIYQTVSCGDDCWVVVPQTYHECLEREP